MSVSLTKLQPPSFYLNNLIILRKHIAKRPVLRLATYTTRPELAESLGHPCGTLHCLAGEIPTIPHFQDLGIVPGQVGSPGFAEAPEEAGAALLYLFGQPEGCDAWYALANTRAHGTWDNDFAWGTMTDKELALARLDRAIAYYTNAHESGE